MEQIQNPTPSPVVSKVSHVTAGLIIAALLIIYSLILNFSGQMGNQTLGWVSYIFLFAGVIYFVMQFAKSRDNHVTFGQLFSFGFRATAIATLVLLAFQLLFFLVFPEYKDKIIDISREQMIERGGMTDEQIEQAVGFVRKFFWMTIVGGTLFMTLIMGCIASLVAAAVTKKQPVSPFQKTGA